MTTDVPAEVIPYWGNATPVDVGPLVDAAATNGKSADMRIYGPIASIGAPYAVSADEFGKALDSLDGVDTINLHIHSPGGSAFDGIAIKNQLQQHAAAVNVIVDGLAASAASLIAMAGDTVSMAPSSQMMIHDASALVVGQPTDLRQAADMLESISDSYADAYAAKAGGDAADWRAAMQPETWYKAQEAVDAGLADRVLPKAKKSAEPTTTFDLTVFAHAGREHAPEPFMPTATAVPTHSTATKSGSWDGPGNESKLDSPMSLATAKNEYAWYDATKVDSGEITKSACKFPHHFVASDGTPGAASISACQSVISILNGGRGGADIPSGDRRGVYNHVANHLRDAKLTPAPLALNPSASPEHPPKEGAVMLTDSEIKALREGLDLPEDADAAAIQAKVAELAARPEKADAPKITDEAIAAHFGVDAEKFKDVVAVAKGEKQVASSSYLASLEANAKLGAEARAEQLAKARDEAIDAKITGGFISRDQRESWQRDWDRDPSGTKAELDKFDVPRFPVGDAPGSPGSESDATAYTDDMAAEDAALFGLPKEAFV